MPLILPDMVLTNGRFPCKNPERRFWRQNDRMPCYGRDAKLTNEEIKFYRIGSDPTSKFFTK